MAYQLTTLGSSVVALFQARPKHGLQMAQPLVARHAETLADRVEHLITVPVHEFPQVAVALTNIDTLDADAATSAVDDLVEAVGATHAELPAAGFAGSMRADQPRSEGTNEVEI